MEGFVSTSKKNIKFSSINLQKYCKEQDLEIAAVKLKFPKKNVISFCVYRAPTGELDYFLKKLDTILNSLHNPKTEFIFSGELNINYIGTNNKKTQLDNMLSTYNLTGTVYFPARITNTSTSSIDNIFVDSKNNYTIKPYINGLSDHDAQLFTLNNLAPTISIIKPIYIRRVNKNAIAEFQSLLSWEQWDKVFGVDNVNIMFNNFLSSYLRCYYSSFMKINVSKFNQSHNEWITKGIKVSCQRKKELFVLRRVTNNNNNFKLYYKKYC